MPQFDKVDVDDIQEVINAIKCSSPQGPYFNVGGQYVHPDEIVSFEGPEEKATFYLSDGRTLTHEKFKEEQNGDILYRALKVMRRPLGKSQLVKPSMNRIVEGTNQILWNSGFTAIGNTPSGFFYPFAFDVSAGKIFAINGAKDKITVASAENGSKLSEFTLNTFPNDAHRMVGCDTGTQKIYWVERVTDSNNYATLRSADYDGSNETIVNQAYKNSGGGRSADIFESKDAMIDFDGNDIYLVPLDGSTAQTIGSSTACRNGSKVNKEDKFVRVIDDNTLALFDANGNLIETKTRSDITFEGGSASSDWARGFSIDSLTKAVAGDSGNDIIWELNWNENKAVNKKSITLSSNVSLMAWTDTTVI